MYLLIDNSNSDNVALSVWLNNKWVQHVYPASVGLLASIDQCLKEVGKTTGGLKGLAVVVGIGSFTSTRIAVTVANTLAYALGIKVIAVDAYQEDDLVEKIETAESGILISAVYSGEPNIGKKKTK